MSEDYELRRPADGVPIKAGRAACRSRREALAQLENIARLPFVHRWVAAMPDVHLGIGATVGSVIPTLRRDHPGGGGRGHRLRHDGGADDAQRRATCPTTCAPLRSAIERGGAARPRQARRQGRPRRVGRASRAAIASAWARARAGLRSASPTSTERSRRATTSMHLGTLGTGNHFIELCLDEARRVWVMLHSGSRGVGNRIGSYFIELAKKDMQPAHAQPARRRTSRTSRRAASTSTTTSRRCSWAQEFARDEPRADDGSGARRAARLAALPPFQTRDSRR